MPGLAGLDQGDPSLVEAVQHLFLAPPSLAADLQPCPGCLPQLLQGDGQAAMLDQTYFNERKKGGFFVGKLI